MEINCYEKIINNYLESLYLEYISFYKDSDMVIKSIYRAFEKVFVVEFDYINFLTIKDRIVENMNLQFKNKEIINQNDKYYDIDERLYLFNFNVFKYFNDTDNKIIINMLIHKLDLNKIASLLNFKEEFVLERFISIIRWMRVYFINTIKPFFEK